MTVKKLFALFALLFFASVARGQDVRVNCSQVSACTLTPAGGIPWSSGNLTFIFRPMNPRVSVYIFIRNQNPTSAHTTQTISVFQTPFSQDLAPSLSQNSSRWTQDQITQNTTVGAACNNVNAANDLSPGASGLGTCYVNTMFAAQVAIKITGASSAGGSPDNFDLAIIQESGVPGGQTPGSPSSVTLNGGSLPLCLPTETNAATLCSNGVFISDAIANTLLQGLFSANNNTFFLTTGMGLLDFNGTGWDRVRGTANTGLSDAPAIQVVSDGLSQAFTSAITSINPVTTNALAIDANSGTKTLYFDRVLVFCTAACTIQIAEISTAGSGCTSSAITNQKAGSATSSTASASTACATLPTVFGSPVLNLPLAAGTFTTLDLRGLIAPSAGTTGLELNVTSFTGTLNATIFWYEK